jgi:hypothetical protein
MLYNKEKGIKSYITSAETDRQFWSDASKYYTEAQIAEMARLESAMRKKIVAQIENLPNVVR